MVPGQRNGLRGPVLAAALLGALLAVAVSSSAWIGAPAAGLVWGGRPTGPGGTWFAPGPRPVGVQWTTDKKEYRATATVELRARGWQAVTGVDVTMRNVLVLEDGTPVEAGDYADRLVNAVRLTLNGSGPVAAGALGTAAAPVGTPPPLEPRLRRALERAAASPGVKQTAWFDECVVWERLMVARGAAISALTLALVLPAGWIAVRSVRRLAAWRQQRAERGEVCIKCGYALAGLAEGMPCPECGTPAVRSRDPYVERLKKKEWR